MSLLSFCQEVLSVSVMSSFLQLVLSFFLLSVCQVIVTICPQFFHIICLFVFCQFVFSCHLQHFFILLFCLVFISVLVCSCHHFVNQLLQHLVNQFSHCDIILSISFIMFVFYNIINQYCYLCRLSCHHLVSSCLFFVFCHIILSFLNQLFGMFVNSHFFN